MSKNKNQLATLPPNESAAAALAGMDLPELEKLHGQFAELQNAHDRMSGVAGTMRGLALMTIKQKLGHGEWLPWLKANYGTGVRRAQDFMFLAKQFLANPSASKALPEIMDAREALTRNALDLANPVIAGVAKWAEDRSAAQLLLDFRTSEPARRGGRTYDRADGKGARKSITPEQAREILQTLCTGAAESLRAIHEQTAFAVLTPAELDGLIDHCAEVIAAARRWRSLTPAQRSAQLAKLLSA